MNEHLLKKDYLLRIEQLKNLASSSQRMRSDITASALRVGVGQAPTQKRRRPGPARKERMGRPGAQPKGKEGEDQARPDPSVKEG